MAARRAPNGAISSDSDDCSISPELKRSRSLYMVESPGGTFHETSPTKIYSTNVKKGGKLPDRLEPPRFATDGSTKPQNTSVRDTLLLGVARSFERDNAHAALAQTDEGCPFASQPVQISSTVVGLQSYHDTKHNTHKELSFDKAEKMHQKSGGLTMSFPDTLPGQPQLRRRRITNERQRVDQHRQQRSPSTYGRTCSRGRLLHTQKD